MSDNSKSLSLVDELLQSTPVGIAYDRLQSACMFAISLGMKAGVPPPYWNRPLLQEIWDRYGMPLLSLADSLASRPIRPTGGMFKCDLLKWKIGGIQTIQVTQTLVEKKSLVSEPQVNNTRLKSQLSLSEFSKMVKRMVSI